MILTEKELFEFIKCPVRYDLYSKGYDIDGENKLKDYMQLVMNNYYTKIKTQPHSYNILRNKWDSILKNDEAFASVKSNYMSGLAMINLINMYFEKNNVEFLDTNTPYTIEIEGSGVSLKGVMNPIIQTPDEIVIFVFDYGKTLQSREALELNLKYNIDAYACYKFFKKNITVCVHNVQKGITTTLHKSTTDYVSLEHTIRVAGECIRQKLIDRRPSFMCERCNIKHLCKNWTLDGK